MNPAETAMTVGYNQASAGLGDYEQARAGGGGVHAFRDGVLGEYFQANAGVGEYFDVQTSGLGEYFWGDSSPGDVRDGIFTTFAGVGAMDDKQKKMLIFGGIGAAVLLGVGLWYMKKKR